MKNEDFENLKTSVIEAGQILRGEQKPSREFSRQIDERQSALKTEKTWAICVSAGDDALTPLKLYEVRFAEKTVGLRDDTGESLICPANWFVAVSFAPEVEQAIQEFAKAA